MPTTTKSTLTRLSGSATSLRLDTLPPETLTSEASLTCVPTISEATHNATSSPASPDGALPSDSPDGQTTDLFGQDLAPANPSPQPEKAKHQAMNATSGPAGSSLSELADRQSSLANRLKRQLDGAGSTLFTLTWRKKATPLGRPYYELAASARRISDSDCGSWPTPRTTDGHNKEHGHGGQALHTISGMTLSGSPAQTESKGQLASWPTPMVADINMSRGSQRIPEQENGEVEGTCGLIVTLTDHSAGNDQLASWPTPNAMEGGQTSRGGDRKDEKLMGGLPTGKGQLNPSFSLWLMGYPPEWLNSAPPATRLSRKSRQSS
jgi:hypothetical protein